MAKKEYKVITCASYGGTGSGVVTDLVSEFKGSYCPGDFEFRFIQDYDGITTLESALIDNHHRLNSDIAIRRFKHIIDHQSSTGPLPKYEKFFNGKFKEISYKYIDSITDLTWKGYWEHHQVDKSVASQILFYKVYPRIKKIFRKPSEKSYSNQPPKQQMYFAYPTREAFYRKTKAYTNELCSAIDPEGKYDFIFMDQLVPPENISRYFNYFDNLKVIVVDRDPRDLYILNEHSWKESWIPSQDIDIYIKWFKLLREHQKHQGEDPERVLRIQFEDVVVKYDESVEKIIKFLGLRPEDHIEKKKYFNPDRSIKNMRLYKKISDKNELDKIKRIEKELSEYCYNE